jgi:hypothetical protein
MNIELDIDCKIGYTVDMKIETKTIHKIYYADFEALVNDPETYGFEEHATNIGGHIQMRRKAYDFVADIECGNDSSHEYDGITKTEAAKEFESSYYREEFEDWKNSNAKTGLGSAHLILLDLVQRDLIPEGDYIIWVCW